MLEIYLKESPYSPATVDHYARATPSSAPISRMFAKSHLQRVAALLLVLHHSKMELVWPIAWARGGLEGLIMDTWKPLNEVRTVASVAAQKKRESLPGLLPSKQENRSGRAPGTHMRASLPTTELQHTPTNECKQSCICLEQ